MTEEHFDEAFDFAASLAEQRRLRDEEERRTDPIHGLPGEPPDVWYARRLREVRERNFDPLVADLIGKQPPPPPGRMVPRFDPKEDQKRVADLEQTSRLNRELEALRKLEVSVIENFPFAFRDELEAVKKARRS